MTYSVKAYLNRTRLPSGRLLIDGEWRAPLGHGTFSHVHPATNEVIMEIPAATREDVDEAVSTARRAFDVGPWPAMRAGERTRLLFLIAERLRDHAEELAYLQTFDNGMPIRFSKHSRASANNAADIFMHYAGWIDKITGETYPQYSADNDLQFMTFREAVGVVAAILPWNAPVMMFAMKVAPALATGCCAIVKPSENASLCVMRMSEILQELGLPPGVLSVVTGGPDVGQALVDHLGVDKVTFTGSKGVGGKILSASGRDIKRVTLELGGKSAALVFPDARSVAGAATHIMALCSTFLSGQVCSTTTRAVVHRSVMDEFIESAVKQTESVCFGDPFDSGTTSAPIINGAQVDKIMQYIEAGKAEGAELVVGGDRPSGDLANGNWVNPTLFANVSNTMRIAREEIFGPVLSVIPFDSEDEAVAIANDSEYGLSGGIYSTDMSNVLSVARRMRTGSVGINGYSVMPNSPAGGVKASGLGREGGWPTIEAFTELKTVMVNLAG